MGRRKKEGGMRSYSRKRGRLLERVTEADWYVQLPGGGRRERLLERLGPLVIFLMAVLGSGLAVLEILEPEIDKRAFVRLLLLFVAMWQGVYWNKRTAAWGQLAVWAGVIFCCLRSWEQLLCGGRMAANILLEKTNIIYEMNLGLFAVDNSEPENVFLFLGVLFCWLSGMLGVCTVYRISVSWLALILSLLLCGGLWVGKVPSFLPFFLVIGAIYGSALLFYGRRLPGSRIQRRAGLLTMGALVLALVLGRWWLGPLVEPRLLEYHDAVEEVERRFEKWVWEEGFEKLNFLEGLGSHSFNDGALSNSSPDYENKKAASVRTSLRPQRSLYLRGYAGEFYTGEQWTEVSQEEFYENASQWAEASFGAGLWAQDLYRESLWIRAAMEGEEAVYASSFQLEYGTEAGDYSLLPYEAQLTDQVREQGDGWTLREGDAMTAEGILPNSRLYAVDELAGLERREQQRMESYEDYVYEHYRSIPAQGVERLQEYAEELLEQGFSGQRLVREVQRELRSRCKYNTRLDPVPRSQDFAEYFFFESREGFCTHFATTAVLLYRMCGLPARYRTGYVAPAGSFRQQEDGSWEAVVMDNQAHAWAEVYVRSVGWVPVEVTPGYGGSGADFGGEDAVAPPVSSPAEEPQEPEAVQEPEEERPEETPEAEGQEEVDAPGGSDGPRDVRVKGKPALGLLLNVLKAVLALLILTGVILLRRLLLISRRRALMGQRDPGRAVREASYAMQELLEAGGCRASPELYDQEYGRQMAEQFPELDGRLFPYFVTVAQKAVFSSESCTQEEARWCRMFYSQVKKLLWNRLSWREKLWWLCIKCF